MTPGPPAHPRLIWRPAVPDDAARIAALQDACFVVDDGYRETAAEVLERFESPMLDASTDSLVGIRDDGSIVVSLWSLLVPEPEETWKVYDDNYVHPDVRTPEMTRFAVGWWMARSLERVRNSGIDLPVVFHQHVYPVQKDHISLIESIGFEPSIWFDELRRDLSLPIPEITLPPGYELIPHDSVPADEALALRNDAFRDHRGSQPWSRELWESRLTDAHRADASFAIIDGDRPVAYTVCEAYPHDAEDRGYTEGWIMGVGTARSHRGKGLASAVICASMKVFRDEGLDYATLEVDTENPTGAAGLYARLGFERVRGYVSWTKTVDPRREGGGSG